MLNGFRQVEVSKRSIALRAASNVVSCFPLAVSRKKIPLAPQEVALLRETRGMTGNGRFSFRPIGARGLHERKHHHCPLRRLDFTKEEMTAHGLVRLPHQMLNECSMWNADATERQLAHDDTVYATSATLNAGDSLTGGAGRDVLALVDSGSFDLGQLATFTGFERIRLDNATNSSASLTLGSQPIEVDATGYLQIFVNSPSNWNGSNIINGDASRTWSTASLSFNSPLVLVEGLYHQLPIIYDLTSNTFSHVANINGGSNVTFLINNADTAGFQSFSGIGPNSKLATAGSTLDLSHTTVAAM
ncbi:hypothetical protein [Bradyrhizobium sp. AUGA SZCCT0042]|uniref:hypothetical protein n=1 Tax=Bradyrhizobium sp. AUGA SZCCT0042 TaxID=2807651 RepID=UPI001BA9C905|nr:hypothetical protein [Bradyrhizobium sp. AUGA SZCCT0042]MBR1301741.1 hypothetical protein [Bradyrhizobium sp. AUGA SZCCT0042]